MKKSDLQIALDIEYAILDGLNDSSKRGLPYVYFSQAWDTTSLRINALQHAFAIRGWKPDDR